MTLMQSGKDPSMNYIEGGNHTHKMILCWTFVGSLSWSVLHLSEYLLSHIFSKKFSHAVMLNN